jgi:hypothetical protein
MKAMRIMLAVLALSATQACAQWDHALDLPDRWFGWRDVALEVREAIQERAVVRGTSSGSISGSWTDPAMPGWFGQRATLVAYKAKVKQLIPVFVNPSLTNAAGALAPWEDGFAPGFRFLSATGACAIAGVETNFLDKTPWYGWNEEASWGGMARVIDVLRWTGGRYLNESFTTNEFVDARVDNVWPMPATNCATVLSQMGDEWDAATPAFDPSQPSGIWSESFYWAYGLVLTNVTSLQPRTLWKAQRGQKVYYRHLGDVPTNFVHRWDLYGRVERFRIAGSGSQYAPTFSDVDGIGSGDTAVVLVSTNGYGSGNRVSYKGVFAGGLAGMGNPATLAGLDCNDASNNVSVTAGAMIRMQAAMSLWRWDASTNGFKYILSP